MMKKLILIPMVAVTCGFSDGYTQGDRILDMQKMAQAMQDIQMGFFYNNIDIVKDGVKVLTATIDLVRPIDSEINNKDIYEQWLNNDLKMTRKIQKKIKNKAQEIEDRFTNGDPEQALQAYTKITKQCLKCHVNLRKW
ncbi:MAG: cytochrome C [Sulfurovum sp.]|nr:MAG: cytochrome C [Sulfurovum sp.]